MLALPILTMTETRTSLPPGIPPTAGSTGREQDGSGTSWGTHTLGSANYPHRVTTWDPDSDGDIDILCSQYMSWTSVRWWENLGSNNWECHDVYSGAQYLITGSCDIDQDGDEDFVLCRYSDR